MSKKQAPLSNYFGVPPPPKKPLTEPEPRKRVFSEKWLQEVGWLQTNDTRTEMWCKLCRENPTLADKTSAFYVGTNNFNHPVFDRHTKSREHQKVVESIANKRSQDERSRGPLGRWQDKLSEEQHQALTNMFLLAFHKAKHARPMRSYEEDIPLLKRLGVNIGTAYHSREGGARIMETIAQTISSELREKLNAAEFWGVLFDGSEDITKTEQEIVYIVSVSNMGEYSSDYLGLINLGANRTAQDIVDGLEQLFNASGLTEWKKKLVSVCSDGAAVNVGAYNGVVSKLRQMVDIGDSLVHILCTAHTLENCAKSADRAVPYCESFNKSIVTLLSFYLKKGGAKRIAQLQKICEEKDIAFVKLGKFHNIRWSAWRQETLMKIGRMLPAIQIQVATSDDSSLKHICTERFRCFLANMLDIGDILQFTSLRFQRDNLTIGECKDELMAAIGQMTLLMDSEGKYRKETVGYAEADRDKIGVLRALIDEFDSRYESLKSCDQFLIFDPTTWPQEMKDIHSFGNTTLSNILEKYEASLHVDKDSTLREWMHLKQAGKRLAASSVHELVNVVNTSNPGSYSNIQKVLLLSLTLPLSSAACERGFSQMNIIKNKYRSCLSDTRLSSLMHIHLSKYTTETFDPKPAVDLWLQTASRRLNQEERSRPSASSVYEIEEESEEGSDDDNDDGL